MERIFANQISRSVDGRQHLKDLKEVFKQVRRYGMRLNPAKCTFGVAERKFLGFMLTARGIKANPDKCAALLEMQSPTTLKEVGRLTALSRFILKLAE